MYKNNNPIRYICAVLSLLILLACTSCGKQGSVTEQSDQSDEIDELQEPESRAAKAPEEESGVFEPETDSSAETDTSGVQKIGEDDREEDPQTVAYRLYYDKLMQLQEEFGLGGIFWEDGQAELLGLSFAKLVDLDDDGIEELIIAYRNHSDDYYMHYDMEVWGTANGELQTLYHGYCGFSQEIFNSVKLGKWNNKNTFLQFIGADEYEKYYEPIPEVFDLCSNWVMGMENGNLVPFYSFAWEFDGPDEIYWINGRKVTGDQLDDEEIDSLNGGFWNTVEEYFLMGTDTEYLEKTIDATEATFSTLREKLGISDSDSEAEDLTGEELLERMSRDYLFTSGAGAWGTEFTLEKDGSFTGTYHDSEMGDVGPDYPNGSVYICNFKGKFSVPQKVDSYIYSMKLESIELESTPGEEFIEDGTRYIYADPYGFDDADEFLIYLPGCPLDAVAEDFLWWSFISTDVRNTIPSGVYGLYNVGGMEGSVGTTENSIWDREYTYEYNGLRSALQPSYYGMSHLLFWPEDGAAVLSLIFNWSQDDMLIFQASDSNGTGEYRVSLDFDEETDTVSVSLKSFSGYDLSPWGGTAEGTLDAVYTYELT